jgi:hypothetical protein
MERKITLLKSSKKRANTQVRPYRIFNPHHPFTRKSAMITAPSYELDIAPALGRQLSLSGCRLFPTSVRRCLCG